MQGIKNNHNLTYKSGTTKQQLINYMKAVGIPSLIFILSLFVILRFANFGKILLGPLILLMWGSGIGCAIFLPSHRETIIRETMTTIGVYLVTLMGLRIAISLLSGVSSSMLAASFNQAIPETSGNTALGYIQNMLYIASILTPLGFCGMQFQRVYKLRRNANKKKFFDQVRDIRDTNKDFQ